MRKIAAAIFLFLSCTCMYAAAPDEATIQKANAALERAVQRNDVGAIQKAIEDGATNANKIAESMKTNPNARFSTFMVLKKSAREYIHTPIEIGNFCKSGYKPWQHTISYIEVDYKGREKVFAYTDVKYDAQKGVQYKTTEIKDITGLSEQEKFIWHAKDCDAVKYGLGDDEDFVNCYFDMIEKYCAMDKTMKFYEDTVAAAQKYSEEMLKKEKKNQ
ncbi:MAG: hypothetical protein FWG18_00320, partial [Alphaproteobacteria bacterium]|nr:hypothetical protein [Alphaproteobacteria bacterium]